MRFFLCRRIVSISCGEYRYQDFLRIAFSPRWRVGESTLTTSADAITKIELYEKKSTQIRHFLMLESIRYNENAVKLLEVRGNPPGSGLQIPNT